MQTKHYLWLVLIAGLILGAGAWLLFVPRQAQAPSQSSTASTTTVDLGGGIKVQVPAGTTLTQVGTTTAVKGIQPPALRPINYAAGIDPTLKAALQSQYNTLSSRLVSNPRATDTWLSLGTDYKIGGDYPGAIAAWNYVAKADTGSLRGTAWGNLGDLYLNFTHQYAQAVVAYKSALALQPNNPDYQAGLQAAQQAE